jgi:hypothetical protein
MDGEKTEDLARPRIILRDDRLFLLLTSFDENYNFPILLSQGRHFTGMKYLISATILRN